MAKLIEQTYGQALYELAAEDNKISILCGEAKALREAFSDGDDFMRFIKNPRITQDEKKNVLETSLKGSISDDMLGFLVILCQKDRLSKVNDILDHFISRVMEEEGRAHASVISPMELSDAQKESVRSRLLSTTGYKEIDIDYSIDESLIGGLVIRIGDRVVDSSIRTRLGKIKRELIQIKV